MGLNEIWCSGVGGRLFPSFLVESFSAHKLKITFSYYSEAFFLKVLHV